MAARLGDGAYKKAAVAGDEDRISALTDDVLQLVLSFLPSQEAVQTCVLATRWRTLWKSVPSLRIDTCDWLCAHDSNRFVRNLLHYRDRTAPLGVCKILCCEVEDYDNEEDNEAEAGLDEDVEQWVQYAVSCKARVIGIHASDKMFLPLSNETLISEHMTKLKLSYVEFEDNSVDLSSCHALEVLKIQDCVLNLVGIFSKSLRRLKIENSHHLTRMYCTSISAPGLVKLELANCPYWTLVLESLPSLVTAFIRTHKKEDCYGCYSSSDESSEESSDEDDDRHDGVILQGLAGATNLELITRSPMDFLKGLEDCYVFSKLKTLLLDGWCVAANFTGLVYFLQHSPNLEKLRLEPVGAQEFQSGSEICGSYNPREHFLVSKHLKVVEILYCDDDDDDIINQIWKILCTHGVSPELIEVEQYIGTYRWRVAWEAPP